MFGESKLTNRAVIEYPLGHPPERMPLEAVRAPDPRVVIFRRVDGDAVIVVRNGATVAQLEQTYRYHSDGLNFGYMGSGPADCALNILSLVVSPREAWRFHQQFKSKHVATIPQDAGGELPLATVRAWIAAEYEAELRDAELMAEEKEMRELLAEIEAEEASLSEAED